MIPTSVPEACGWTKLPAHNPLSLLAAKWWGKSPEDVASGTTITLTSSGKEIQWETTFLDTDGRIFIRQEYEDLYKRLQICDSSRTDGRVISGSPGIGKSVFLLYALVMRLREKKTTVYFSVFQRLFLFFANEVFEVPSQDFEIYEHLSNFLPPYRIWSLVDTAAEGGSPPLAITMPDVFFTVHTASPNRHHYGEWTSQHGGVMLIMNPWSIEELYAGLRLHNRFHDASRVDIAQAFNDCGPCIRDIIFNRLNPGAFEAQTKATLASPVNAEKLKHLVAHAREIDAMAIGMNGHVSHKLFYIQRFVPDDPQPLRPDAAFIVAKTSFIANELLKTIHNLTLMDAGAL
ncbi:hypothetical protein BDN71DRAFT_1444215 [Pleurotus eryngii]|uniref:Uncharacterized protein n=1 Tax=Pleurotus eryngii TaxID=5323 RepID=A0A9P6DHR3_PLEER|nr:hypothetical protein BDN71DRAFT_1444215 [Pleurotus eryngii]